MRLPQPAAAKGKKVSFHSSSSMHQSMSDNVHLLCKDSCLYDVLHVLKEISKKKNYVLKFHVFVWMVLTDLCGVH